MNGSRLIRVPLLLIVAGLAISACSDGSSSPYIEVHTQPWYNSGFVRIPVDIGGDARPIIDYLYEYSAGETWEIGAEGSLRLSNDSPGLIEFQVEPTASDHRITASVLARPAPGQPLEQAASSQRFFRVDVVPPSADPTSLSITTWQDLPPVDGVFVPVDPSALDEFHELEVRVDHVEFDNPIGSNVTVYIVRNAYPPNEIHYDEETTRQQSFQVWPGGGGPQYHEYRIIVIDEAGNRSSVRVEILQAGP